MFAVPLYLECVQTKLQLQLQLELECLQRERLTSLYDVPPDKPRLAQDSQEQTSYLYQQESAMQYNSNNNVTNPALSSLLSNSNATGPAAFSLPNNNVMVKRRSSNTVPRPRFNKSIRKRAIRGKNVTNKAKGHLKDISQKNKPSPSSKKNKPNQNRTYGRPALIINLVQCTFCNRFCMDNNDLRKHLKEIHSETQVITCEICDMLCLNENDMTQHKLTHHQQQQSCVRNVESG